MVDKEYDHSITSKEILFDKSNFTLETRANHKVTIPLAFVKELASMEANFDDLASALWFYRAIKDAEDYKWVKIVELENVNLTGWSLWHYREDYEYSDWEYISLPFVVKRDEEGRLFLKEILNTEYSNGFFIDEEEVLIIKPTSRIYSQEIVMTMELEKKYAETKPNLI